MRKPGNPQVLDNMFWNRLALSRHESRSDGARVSVKRRSYPLR